MTSSVAVEGKLQTLTASKNNSEPHLGVQKALKGANEPFWGIIEPLQGMIEEPVQGTNELHVGNDTIQTPLIDRTSAKAVVSEQYVRTKNCFNDYNFSIDFLESCGTILNKTPNAC